MRPFATQTELLPHQAQAINKVSPAKVGALFMDMGTGKTRTTIELVKLRAHKIDKVVWFCPVSLRDTIQQEILKHTDCTKQDIFIVGDKARMCDMPTDRMWYIVGIESLSASNRIILCTNALISESTFVVLDESSYIKGYDALRTIRSTRLSERAMYRLILTGTPISQGVVDLYSQMRFLSPKILGYRSFYSFALNHLEYHPEHPGLIVASHNVEYLSKKIEPYVYQCTKDECLSIPSKVYAHHYTSLREEQLKAYEEAKGEFADEYEKKMAFDEKVPSTAIFKLFTALQSIVCGFWNHRKPDGGEMEHITFEHSRVETLMDVIRGIPKDKIIIWGKYLHSIAEIRAALTSEYGAEAVCLYHGKLGARAREEQLDLFRGDARFLVGTQSCAGHGLNLQFAHCQIFYANGFKYSERIQAEDRCHRHGQRRKVLYVDIFAYDTIDRRIEDALDKKANALKRFRDEVERIKENKGKGFRELVMSL